MKPKPSLIALAAAWPTLLLAADTAFAATGEKTPLHLNDSPSVSTHTNGGSLVRTVVGLAVVIAVIYGLYWILKQVKSSREEKASGEGLAALATLPLGPSRSLQLVRAGRELVLLGVSEHGVTPVRTYTEDEAEAAGLLDLEADAAAATNGRPGSGGSRGVWTGMVDEMRRRTVRR